MPGENARGKDASFVCGSFVQFSVSVDAESKSVAAAGFQTNGCGFMTAAADVLVEAVKGRRLGDLHGLARPELLAEIEARLGVFTENRRHCADCCIDALAMSFANYRTKQIEEFQGEKALICTCFGVTEETIELQIDAKSLNTIEEVTQICNAGGGCGSCRMLIQEMLDTRTGL